MAIHKGGCACGAVRFETIADPLRVGLGHSMTCRKHHGSIFVPFAVFRFQDVLIAGALHTCRSSDHGRRLSCDIWYSPICYLEDEGAEIELNLGRVDATGLFELLYENWIAHREDWLPHGGLTER